MNIFYIIGVVVVIIVVAGFLGLRDATGARGIELRIFGLWAPLIVALPGFIQTPSINERILPESSHHLR